MGIFGGFVGHLLVWVLPHFVRRASIVHRWVALWFDKRVFSLLLEPSILPVATWWCGAPTFGAAAGDTTLYGWWARTNLLRKDLVAKPSMKGLFTGVRSRG